MKKLLEIFWVFFKIGLFTFGGGYAMLSIIENECIEKRNWITKEEFLDITVIAESTPGPVAINASTFVGYRQGKFWGAVAGMLGVVLPSFIIIYCISLFFDNILEYTVISNAFSGIKVCVGVLILRTGIKMLKSLPKKPLFIVIFCVALAISLVTELLAVNFSSIWLIIASGIVGYSAYLIAERKAGDRG